MTGPGFDAVLHPAMDFVDPYVVQTANMPENQLYGTWHENKVGIYTLQPGAYTIRFESIGSSAIARVGGAAYTQGGFRYLEEDAGRPGLDMGLDGVSLRKLRWEGMWAWMQDYLAREEVLFEEWITTARADVDRIAAAVVSAQRESGSWPDDLSSIGETGLDPWGQPYRYRRPGVHNPDGFDVWSVHGNERDPEGWIGNW